MPVDSPSRQFIDTQPAAPSKRSILLAALLLLALNIAVFGQVLSFQFLIWDDEFYVVPHLQREGGLTVASVRWAFTNRQAGWFTPIPYISLFADTQLYGLNPAGYHLTNLILHCASTLVLLWVFTRMTGQLWAAGLTAMLFAIHPLHVEPVVWITTRWELLCALFWMLGLAAYASYCRTGSKISYLAMIAAYACALLSKPMALTFPFVLLLLDYWPLRRVLQQPGRLDTPATSSPISIARAICEKIPLFVLMVLNLYVSLQVKHEFLATKDQIQFPFVDRLMNSIETYAIYLLQFFWPSELHFFYPHPALIGGSPLWRVAAAGALLMAVTVAALLLARRHPWFIVGWLWYLGVFVPAIGWVQVEEHARADRYTYLPLIGLSLVAAWYAAEVTSRFKQPRLARFAISFALAAVLVPAAHRQASFWHNSHSLMRRGVEADPRNFKAWFNLGHLAVREGDLAAAEEYYRGALRSYDGSRAHYLVGHVLELQGRLAESVPYYQASLDRNPAYTRARGRLAGVFLQMGKRAEAAAEYRQAIAQDPGDAWAHTYYAHFLSQIGDYSGAASHYRHILNLAPEAERIPMLLGEALEKSGDVAAAVALYRDYYQQNPRRVDIANRLAWLRATHNDARIRDGQEALRLSEELARLSNYENPLVLDTLAAAYAETGDFRRAVATAAAALALARAAGDEPHAADITRRLETYQKRSPYRDAKPPDGGPVEHASRQPSTEQPSTEQPSSQESVTLHDSSSQPVVTPETTF